MGLERDYLMRQLMMLMEVIQKIASYRKKGQQAEADEEITYFYNCLTLNPDFHQKSIKAIFDYLTNEKKLTNDQLEMIAFVLKEQGELALQDEQKIDFFRKSYFLLDKVERESTAFSMNRQMNLAELKDYLEHFS
jgi:hypothetical protein